jgi:hypothetical protein
MKETSSRPTDAQKPIAPLKATATPQFEKLPHESSRKPKREHKITRKKALIKLLCSGVVLRERPKRLRRIGGLRRKGGCANPYLKRR